MNQLIKNLNSSMEKKAVEAVAQKSAEHDNLLEQYTKLLESGETIELRFDSSDDEGSLVTASEGVTFIVKRDDQILGRYQQAFGTLVGSNINVKVKEVDKKADIVYLEMTGAKSTLIQQIRRELDADLKSGEKPRLFGRVVDIVVTRDGRKSEAWVKLLDKDIPGVLNIRDYSKTYTSSLNDVLKKGEIYEFDVIGSRNMKSRGGASIYTLSRKNITPNPWNNIPASLKENTMILVKCIEKVEDKHYWWGISPYVKNLNIMGIFNKKVNIYKGGWYKCYISELDREKEVFRVLPIEFYPISTENEKEIYNQAMKVTKEND